MRLKLFNRKQSQHRSDSLKSNTIHNKENTTDIRIDNLIISTSVIRKDNDIVNNSKAVNNANKRSDSYKAKWKIFSSLCCYSCRMSKNKRQYDIENAPTEKNQPNIRRANHQETSPDINFAEINSTKDRISSSDLPTNPNQTLSQRSVTFSADTSFQEEVDRVQMRSKAGPRLYPPGRILHVVRKYPKTSFDNNRNSINVIMDNDFTKLNYQATMVNNNNKCLPAEKRVKFSPLQNSLSAHSLPVYQIIETDNKHFNELLISPRMLHDHMPDNLIKCMKAVLEEPAPKKPPRQTVTYKTSSESELSYEENSITDFGQFQISLDEKQEQQRTSSPGRSTKRKSSDLLACIKSVPVREYQNCLHEKYHNYLDTCLTGTNGAANINNSVCRSASMYGRYSQIPACQAPLAKPESFSDLNVDCGEAKERKRSVRREVRDKKARTYHMKKSYLDSLYSNSNLNNNLDEDELKTNLAWWPYSESNSSTQIHQADISTNNSSKSQNSKLNESSYDNLNSDNNKGIDDSLISDDSTDGRKKIVVNVEEDNSQLRQQRITTSTPRTDANYKSCMQFESASPYMSQNTKNSINSMSLHEDNYNSSQPFLSSMDNHKNQDFNSNDEEMPFSESSSSKNNLQRSSSDFNDHNSSSNDTNLDSSIERSLSFGENNCQLNDSMGKDEVCLSKTSFPSNPGPNLDTKLKNKSAQHESNYTSIEKLAILKPQSKDYILCFDTSSIDQTSSVTSNENLAQATNDQNKNKDSSIEISEATTSTDSSKTDGSNKQTSESSDSGVDTARTLSPYVFNPIGNRGPDIVVSEDSELIK